MGGILGCLALTKGFRGLGFRVEGLEHLSSSLIVCSLVVAALLQLPSARAGLPGEEWGVQPLTTNP